jgi:hypothetical protein
MANFFDVNKQVAQSYVRAEQLKGWFLANAKLLLILLSGAMMFCGVTLLAWGDSSLTWAHVLGVAPLAGVAALLAVCIEGGTIFSSAMRIEVKRKISQEIRLLDKVKKSIGSEEYTKRVALAKKQSRVPTALMFVCVAFSVTGAEIFWQKLFSSAEWYFHVIGGVLGIVCSALLIIFELNYELVERVVENCIKSSGLIQTALDQSAKSIIFNELFDRRKTKLATPEFAAIMDKAAEQGLLGVVVEAVQMSGMTVSATQLKRMVDDEAETRQAAEQFLASGGEQAAIEPPIDLQKSRKNANRANVERLYKEIGSKRIMQDMQGCAERLQIDVRTLERHLKSILAEKQRA